MVVEQFGGCQAEAGVITHYKGITRAWGWPWWLCHSCWTRVCWRIALSWLGGWLGGRCTLQTRTVLCCGAVVIICSRFSTCSKSLLTTWILGRTNVLIRCGLHKDSCTQLYIHKLNLSSSAYLEWPRWPGRELLRRNISSPLFLWLSPKNLSSMRIKIPKHVPPVIIY